MTLLAVCPSRLLLAQMHQPAPMHQLAPITMATHRMPAPGPGTPTLTDRRARLRHLLPQLHHTARPPDTCATNAMSATKTSSDASGQRGPTSRHRRRRQTHRRRRRGRRPSHRPRAACCCAAGSRRQAHTSPSTRARSTTARSCPRTSRPACARSTASGACELRARPTACCSSPPTTTRTVKTATARGTYNARAAVRARRLDTQPASPARFRIRVPLPLPLPRASLAASVASARHVALRRLGPNAKLSPLLADARPPPPLTRP